MSRALQTILFLIGISPDTAGAQDRHWIADGIENDALGSVDGGRDVNGDGTTDVIVGAFQAGLGPGKVLVLSGSDGSEIHSLDGDSVADGFGLSVALCGDLDGDGFSEFLVGADGDDWVPNDSGSAYLYSGRSASLLKVWHGGASGIRFGYPVRGLGDVDGDSIGDLAITARNDDTITQDAGAVFVYSGASLAHLFTFYGDFVQAQFGQALGAAGDVNADGYADLVAGAPFDNDNGDRSGSAQVRSGFDGSVLYSFAGAAPIALFGSSVAGAGDLNDDGHADFMIGASNEDTTINDEGHVVVYSGVDGGILFEYFGTQPGDKLGNSVASAGDVNADGIADILLGSIKDIRGQNAGTAWLHSGRTGLLLYRFDGDSDLDYFGTGLSTAGDVNGDGLLDIMVGAPYDDNGGNASGRVSCFGGSEVYLQIDPNRPREGGAITFEIREGTPGGLAAIFVVEIEQAPASLLVTIAVLDNAGRYGFSSTVPPGLAGIDAVFQCFASGTTGGPRQILASGREIVHFR